jgi:hypothetical protein
MVRAKPEADNEGSGDVVARHGNFNGLTRSFALQGGLQNERKKE